jgi:hypothetical protein
MAQYLFRTRAGFMWKNMIAAMIAACPLVML